MKKKGITFVNGLVEVILILVVFVILLQMLGVWNVIFSHFGEDEVCEATFIASGLTKAFGKSLVNPDCKTKRVTITLNREGVTDSGAILMPLQKDYPSNLPEMQWNTYKRVVQWNELAGEPDSGIPATSKYPYIGWAGITDPTSPDVPQSEKELVRMRYNMDKIFADELKRCWDISGNGKLPLFDNWFKYIGCKDSTGSVRQCDNALDYFKSFGVQSYARFCVLCSRIKFDQDIFDKSKEGYSSLAGTYDSMNIWMANNPYALEHKTSYYEYILDDTQKESLFKYPKFSFSTDRPYAVLFVRVNIHSISGGIMRLYTWADSALSILPFYDGDPNDPVYYANVVTLVPYDEVPNTCDYVVGSYI